MTAYRLRDGRAFRIEGVVFDFDGTLTKPGSIDFAAVHKAVDCPRETGLLEFLAAIADSEERAQKEAVLMAAEMEAAERCEPSPGLEEVVALLREAGVPMAIITRNRREPIERALARLKGVAVDDFACLVTRDLPLAPKPSPESLFYVAGELGLEVSKLLMVGDHAFDVEAGMRAGAITMFLQNGPPNGRGPQPPDADFVVGSLAEAVQVIRCGLCSPRTGDGS